MSIRCLAAALLLGATEESSMNTASAAAPPIDLEAPAALETATFALG